MTYTGNQFNTSVAVNTLGATTLWTPQVGYRWRLKWLQITASSNTSLVAGGPVTLKLQDTSTDVGFSWVCYLPTMSLLNVLGALQSWSTTLTIPQGATITSSALNSPLKLNLSVAPAQGQFTVNLIGFEDQGTGAQ